MDVAAKAERRFAWWLAWLYPPSFRREVGLGLVEATVDRMRARRKAGERSLSVYAAALLDTARNVPAEWTLALRGLRRPAADIHANTRRNSMIDTLMRDVRYALRLWRRRPGFALVAILTLAIGAGANTAMFSIVNAVLLRPLPYPHADRLVSIWTRTQSFPKGLISYKEYESIGRQVDGIEAVGLFFPQSVNITGSSEPQRLVGTFASGSFFGVLGLKAERGRLFSEEESTPSGVKPVVVISHGLWRQRFNQSDAAIGSSLTVNGVPLTIVGVLAEPFNAEHVPGGGYFVTADMYIPASQFPTPGGLYRAGPVMLGVARMKAGVSLAAADGQLDVLAKRLIAEDPKAQQGRALYAESIQETVVGSSRTALLLLFAAVGVVLLIACVNVSHLLLARATDRQKEIALRAALGASRSAVTRQLAVEAAMMAAVAAALGLLLGKWALASLTVLRPPSVPIPESVPIDWTVMAFTGGTAIAVAMLCGLAPALKTSRTDVSRVLQAGSHRASSAGRRTRDLLAVAEMALSVALVAVSALLIQSLLAIQHAPLGFDARNVFTLQFRLPQTKYSKPEDIARFFKAAIENVRAVPGVESAALVRAVPFSGNGGNTGYAVEGASIDPAALPQARFHLVTSDYFKALRIPILKGRDFTDRDDLTAPTVVVVNDTFAKKNWPGDDAIGKRLRVSTGPSLIPATVIGVVGDTKHYTATETPVPQLYLAHYQVPLIFSSLVARTTVAPLSVTNDIRKAIWAVDKDQPMWSIYTLETAVERTQGQSRFLALLLGLFAGTALLLAAVGIYGMTSYGVAQRTHEIGIRIALGASADRVLRDVVGRGVKLTAIGVVLGLVGAVAMGRLASTVLFGVTPTNAASLAGAALALAFVSVGATYVPARRAARVDPVVALADE